MGSGYDLCQGRRVLAHLDAQQIKQFAAAKAYTGVAGSFDLAVREEAAWTDRTRSG